MISDPLYKKVDIDLSPPMSTPTLFQPIKVGTLDLSHRVVFAPSTRYRADENHVPHPIMKEYYSQRSRVPGTLIITEATFIAPQAAGYANVPGIWSEAQIAAWKEIVETVHANGSSIFMQLWTLGRAAHPAQLKKDAPDYPYHSASDVPLSDKPIAPVPLTVEQIKDFVSLYATAASNAVHKAGFDGVEIHNGNGYLLDQFMQEMSNKRTDRYGGSVENRCRFTLEAVEAVAKAVGEERTAIRFSPWSAYQEMLMEDPKPTFSYAVTQIRDNHPNLAYIHLIEPRGDIIRLFAGTEDPPPDHFSNDFIREIWGEKRLISCGYGYNRQSAIETAEKKGDLIAFSRAFIGNPDLPFRLMHSITLTISDRSMFYPPAGIDPKGYTDYPFSSEFHSARKLS